MHHTIARHYYARPRKEGGASDEHEESRIGKKRLRIFVSPSTSTSCVRDDESPSILM